MNIPIQYHKNQNSVFSSPVRYKVVACGRRWGKTRGAITWIVENLMPEVDGQLLLDVGGLRGWWVAPTYAQSKIAYRYFLELFPHWIIEKKNESELRIVLISGNILEFKTADKPDNLRGEKIDSLVLDECGVMNGDVWYEVLRPALMDTKGMACFIGTPKGQNFFFELKAKGEDKTESDYMFKSFSSYDTPFVDNKEIEQAKKEMPDRLFRQEILAEFLEDTGGIFRNVTACAVGQLSDPVHNREYLMGVDLAKYEDFTVLCVMCKKTRQVVAFDRFNQISWEMQEERILDMANRYNEAEILIDRGQVGDAIAENLQRRYDGRVEPIMFTNDNKTSMINKLSNFIEKEQIKFPPIPELLNELKIYQYERLPSGKLRMNAPSGYHDDCVIALGLACWDLDMMGDGKSEFFAVGNRTFSIDDDDDEEDKPYY
jgi:hypothetical protein